MRGSAVLGAASALLLPFSFGLAMSACEDDTANGQPGTSGVDASLEASGADGSRPPEGDGSPGADAASDAGSDGGGQPFTPKSTCDTPAPIVSYTGNDFATRPALAAAPGSPIVAVWDRSVNGANPSQIEAKVFAGGAWGTLATLSTTMQFGGSTIVAAGGGSALVAIHQNDGTGILQRTTGAAFTDVGTAHGELLNQHEKGLRIGSGGHGVEIWRASDTAMGTALIDPTGITVTPLPDNPVAGAIGRATAVIDAAGDGFAFWHDGSTNDLVGRAFRAGAWKGDAAKLAVGGAASGLDAALLPNGDAYVIWSRVDGSPGVHGATIHLDVATSTSSWGTVDDLLTGAGSSPHRVLAAADGELTALWGQSDGSGTNKLTARRRLAGGAWGAPATLGKTTELFGAEVDASGHVTIATSDGSGSAFHYRIAKGAMSWSPAVRVDAKSGAGAVGGNAVLAIDPSTGNPIIAWASGSSVVFTVCH